jgi:hypothetical protein
MFAVAGADNGDESLPVDPKIPILFELGGSFAWLSLLYKNNINIFAAPLFLVPLSRLYRDTQLLH